MDINEATQEFHKLITEPQEQETQEEPSNEDSGQEVTEFGENLEAPAEESVEESTEASAEVSESEDEGADQGAESIELGADAFASLLGIKEDKLTISDDGKVSFRAKVGDEVSDVSLEDMINAYQGSANLTNRSKALAESEKQIQAKLAQINQQSTDFAQQAAAILEGMRDRFTNPYSQEELKALREDDPAEYAARMEEVRQRRSEFEQLANEALQTAQSPQITEETQRQYANFIQQERQKVVDAIPNWEKVSDDVVKYAKEIGYTDDEIGMMADSRIQILLHNSMLFEKGKKEVKQKLKKPIPKITKPGKPVSPQQTSLEARAKLQKQLMETGDIEAAVQLLKATRNK